ncbi:hypothetical protein GOP47_0021536 [Adiantum capillus-veneris]|uniref:Uncharacterized protein n=1 Tax=Adiantum capillus-veneris TaxID=13818 RepID=A0A9D4U7L4_ADICA|nr:hypothetical protein GOP47_0021536 [Adiantum capillus-veneris]
MRLGTYACFSPSDVYCLLMSMYVVMFLPYEFFRGYGVGYSAGTFEQNYRCYPMSFIEKPQLENGDKVIMPPSALDRLASLRIDYPMLFELHNPATSRTSHCGVLEFVAEEGMIYMPYWMMENMLLSEGDIVRVKSATLPKGSYVKLQPHTKDFLDISNPKAVLETTLRNFSCLTVGDNIMVAYNNKKYYIDIIEAKPSAAVSIIETDCEVDFAPPLDYKEPEQVKRVAESSNAGTAQVTQDPEEPEEAKFNAFSGVGRRLDGKLLPQSVAPIGVSQSVRPPQSSSQKSEAKASTSGSRAPGKLVFGGGNASANAAAKQPLPKDPVKEEPSKEEQAKFQPFTGKKYSLRG